MIAAIEDTRKLYGNTRNMKYNNWKGYSTTNRYCNSNTKFGEIENSIITERFGLNK